MRLIENTPDLVLISSPKGIFTLKKSDLSADSQQVVGYDATAAKEETDRKNATNAEYAREREQQQAEALQRHKADLLRKQEMERISAIAAAENARLAQIAEQRRMAEAQKKKAEAEKALQEYQLRLAQQANQERAKREAEEAQRRVQRDINDLQMQQWQLEQELKKQQRGY